VFVVVSFECVCFGLFGVCMCRSFWCVSMYVSVVCVCVSLCSVCVYVGLFGVCVCVHEYSYMSLSKSPFIHPQVAFACPPPPMNHVKIFKGWPLRDAPSELVQLRYKTFPPDHDGRVEMKDSTRLSNKTSTA